MTSKLCESSSSGERLGVPVIDRISDAIRKGDEDTFRQLISLFKLYEAANLNQLDSCGSHPLHWAVMFRRDRMLKTMLHYKKALRLNVDITDAEGVTVLEIAMKHRNHQVVKTLVKHGCSTATSFQELRQQLLGGNYYPMEVLGRESLSASCMSVMAAQCLPTTPVDQITTHERSKRHLWHPISGTHWSSEICEKAVQQCYVDLTKFMDASLIIPLLVQSGHLRLDQVTVILSLQTKREQSLQLLALLPYSGRYAYQALFKALKDETEHGAHRELLQQLESTCDSLQKKSESAGPSQDAFDDSIDFCSGEDQRTQTPAHGLVRSLELSDRSESGIYSASTPGGISATHSGRRLNSATLLGTQSSGQLSMTSQRTSSFTESQTDRNRSSLEKTSVMVGGTINHRASRDFRAVDECPPRSSVKVINAVVKRESAPVQAVVATETNASSAVCIAAGHLFPIQENQTMSTSTKPNLDLSDSFGPLTFSTSGEHEEEDVEKDTSSSEFPKLSSPKPSAPIDIPLRNESCCSLPSAGSVSEVSPRRQLSKQISADTPSSDSDSSDNSYIKLGTSPKYLPHNRSTEHWWTRPFGGLFNRWKGLSPIPDSDGNNKSNSGSPKYVIGCGMRM